MKKQSTRLFQPFLRFWMRLCSVMNPLELYVSTLLEILGLVCLVMVGF